MESKFQEMLRMLEVSSHLKTIEKWNAKSMKCSECVRCRHIWKQYRNGMQNQRHAQNARRVAFSHRQLAIRLHHAEQHCDSLNNTAMLRFIKRTPTFQIAVSHLDLNSLQWVRQWNINSVNHSVKEWVSQSVSQSIVHYSPLSTA